MTENEPPKHKPAWKDNTRAKRQRDRRDRLKEAAQMAGYDTIDQLAAAILNGEVSYSPLKRGSTLREKICGGSKDAR